METRWYNTNVTMQKIKKVQTKPSTPETKTHLEKCQSACKRSIEKAKKSAYGWSISKLEGLAILAIKQMINFNFSHQNPKTIK